MLKAKNQKIQGNLGLNYWCWKASDENVGVGGDAALKGTKATYEHLKQLSRASLTLFFGMKEELDDL